MYVYMLEDEAKLLTANMKFKDKINIRITIDCPIEGCKETFSGDMAEIMISMSMHYIMVHQKNNKFDNYLNNIDAHIGVGT